MVYHPPQGTSDYLHKAGGQPLEGQGAPLAEADDPPPTRPERWLTPCHCRYASLPTLTGVGASVGRPLTARTPSPSRPSTASGCTRGFAGPVSPRVSRWP